MMPNSNGRKDFRRNTQKAKNFKKSFKSLILYCRKYTSYIIISLILAFIASVLAVFGPNKLKELTNTIGMGISSEMDFKSITNITLLLVAIYLCSSLCMAIQGLFMTKVSQNVSRQMRNDIDNKINNVPIKYIDTMARGDLLSRVTNDVDTIAQGLNSSLGTIVHSAALLLATLTMMFITNWILALTAIACSLIGFIIIAIIMKNSQKYFNLQQNSLGKLNGHIEEVYSGYSIIKLYNASKQELEKFEKMNNDLFASAYKSQFLGGLMMPIMNFIGNFGYVAICVVGSLLVLNNKTDVGTIVAFIMYVRIFTNQLTQLAQSLAYLESTAAASERVFEFLNVSSLENESYKTKRLEADNVNGDVDFKNISFGYEKDKQIINNFSISIKAGQKVAIVGPTGAGKTTIVNLLMRFYELGSGDIFIDNVNTKELTRDNIHNLFGMVLQDTWLFTGSLRENLVFNKKDVDDKKINEVINACGLQHYVNTLPQGIDTQLDENITVSSGQKQLITIARAMIQNSPMIILDEATSSIDTRTELLIQKAMDKLSIGRTSFVIAHRLSTIKNADVIIVMQHGDIVETGNHKELIEKKGVYFKLYNSQFEN